jgi:hypothetical protein
VEHHCGGAILRKSNGGAAELRAKAEKLTKRVKSIDKQFGEQVQAEHGCSLIELFEDVRQVAYEEGYAAGKRKAKGRPEEARKVGRPSKIEARLRILFFDAIEERGKGVTVEQVVGDILKRFEASPEEFRKTLRVLPSQEEICRAYFRDRRNPASIETARKPSLLSHGRPRSRADGRWEC